MDKATKKCGDCGQKKPIEEFVTIYGYKNPRGKYCNECYLKHEQEHANELLNGTGKCPYCGIPITKVYDWLEDGKSKRTYLHRDHMNPISLGGDDTDENTIYCCVPCNLRKKDMVFADWLDELEPEQQIKARDIYVRMHGYEPEEFEPHDTKFTITIKL